MKYTERDIIRSVEDPRYQDLLARRAKDEPIYVYTSNYDPTLDKLIGNREKKAIEELLHTANHATSTPVVLWDFADVETTDPDEKAFPFECITSYNNTTWEDVEAGNIKKMFLGSFSMIIVLHDDDPAILKVNPAFRGYLNDFPKKSLGEKALEGMIFLTEVSIRNRKTIVNILFESKEAFDIFMDEKSEDGWDVTTYWEDPISLESGKVYNGKSYVVPEVIYELDNDELVSI